MIETVALQLPQLRSDQYRIVMHPATIKVCAMGRRFGKLLPLDTSIPTPSGWTQMGALQVGDQVFDEGGRPCTVTYVSEIDLLPELYRIQFHDGTYLEADANHQWLTWDKPARKYNGRRGPQGQVYLAFPAIRTTREIRDTLKSSSGESNHAVMLPGPLQYPEQELPVDPYTLGAWLGDGDSRGPYLTVNDEEIPARAVAAGYPAREMVVNGPRGRRWSLSEGRAIAGGRLGFGLRGQLRSLGVLQDKHIPRIYLEASIEQREELLKGLMDTDGTIGSNARCSFEVMNERLAEDVLELVIGLGYLANLRTKRAKLYGQDKGTVYRVGFTPTRAVFHLRRKLRRQRLGTGLHSKYRFIVSVEPVPSRPGRCIQVDSPSHLYLAGRECIPTHNTIMVGTTAIAAAANGQKVGWGAPTYKNTNPLWRWAMQQVQPLVDVGACNINRADRALEFPLTGGRLGVYTLDNYDAIRGEAFHLFAIDEAARVAEEAWTDVIQPTLADYDGQAFLISTPVGRNWFWRLFQEGLQDGKYIASFQAPTTDNPMPSIQRAALRAMQRMPERTYRQEWLAEFVEDALTLFSPEWYNGQNRYNPLAPRHAYTAIGRWISWDTGFKDESDSAFSAAVVGDLMPNYTLQIREVYRERLSFPSLITQIKRLAYQHNADGLLRGIIIEDKASGTSAYQTLVNTTDSWLSRLIQSFNPTGSKSQRAAQAGVWCQNGSVLLPHPVVRPDGSPACPWLYAFEEELWSAPKSLYMDQVDALSQLILWLENLLGEGLDARREAFGDPYPDLIPELLGVN